MASLTFKKLPRVLLDSARGQRVFESVSKKIAAQVENSTSTVNIQLVSALPPAAQTIYWLWRFQCEVGVCGMDIFVLDPLGVYAPQIHHALQTVQASELLRRLEVAIYHARQGPAEFKKLSDQSWFAQFNASAEFPSLESVNEGIFSLAHTLTDFAVQYIRTHGSDLFERPEGLP